MVTTREAIGILQLALFTNHYVIFLCCFSFVSVSTQAEKITCSMPSVEPFQDTVLTCHFPEDLSVTKKDFTIYHYVQQGSPEAVLDCWWVRGLLECYSKPGFTFVKTISRSLNITVHRVVDKHVGKYACQVTGYGSTSLETCDFLFTLDAHDKCSVSKENNDSQMSLTCFFNEDMEKSQRNFTVYKHNEQEKLTVMDCWWEKGYQRCRVEKGYLYDTKVSTYFSMAIPMTTNEKTYIYSCWHSGPHGDQVKPCSFVIDRKAHADKRLDTVALGTTLGVVALAAIAGIVLLMMKRRRNMSNLTMKEEELPLVSSEPDTVTPKFQDFLLDGVKDMYSNMFDGCYFVPPVCFNKTRYSISSVADEVIYVPVPPSLEDANHDRAMQHVIHCLHRMTEQYEEQMFVLTQFKYDDYLKRPNSEFIGHRLPVPGGLHGLTSDQDTGRFDFLIIHRHHGVVVGVVKTFSDKDDCSEDEKRRTDELLISEVSEGMRQLRKADRIIQHLISDKSPIPVVRLSLMLPNITRSTLRRLVGKKAKSVVPDYMTKLKFGTFHRCHKCSVAQQDGARTPHKRRDKGKGDKTMETTIEVCLCADDLSDSLSPWDVDSGVMNLFRKWWDRLMTSTVDRPAMTDGVYQDMIARFCGPATVSALEIDDTKVYQLPKTLNEAVMLTGDLFERLTLSPGILDLLTEPRVCLGGPPGTGKSKTLALVGKKWISEGHVVHLIDTCSVGSDAITHLHIMLIQNSPASSVKRVFCNIENSKETIITINQLINQEKGRTYFALIDEPDADEKKLQHLKYFLQNLNERLPDLHLWVGIVHSDITPPGWRGKLLEIPISCPPSVLRETCKETLEELYSTNNNMLPTDGLPVKNIYHRGQHHMTEEPRDCYACGQEIVRFFKRDLRVANLDTQSPREKLQPAGLQTTGRQSQNIQWQDLLFLFEKNVTEDTPMIQLLKNSGIPVQVINSRKKKKVLNDDKNIVLATNAGFPCGRKRKVVAYVEGAINGSTPVSKRNRLLSITRCASQLILVRMP